LPDFFILIFFSELPLDDTVVGYKVRFEDSTTDKTRIIFQTDGMLLREAMLGNKTDQGPFQLL
jgi:HrpA-like RNA helicase